MDEPQPNTLAEHLKILEKLRVDGVFSGDEFQKIKKRLLETQVGAAPEAQSEQIPGTAQHNHQEQPSADVTSIVDPYRVFKTIALDVLIVCAFGFAGAAIVGIVFHFRLRSTAVIFPLALADALSYTIGYTVVGIRSPGEQYWPRLLYVAIFAWLASIIDVALLGLSIIGWAFSSIWIALAVAMGGGIGLHLRGASKVPGPVENTFERWNWRRIPLRTQLIAAVSAAAIVILGVSYITYSYEPRPQTAYANLKLGMTMQHVIRLKGNSPSKVGEFQEAKDQNLAQRGTPVHDLLTQRSLILFDTIRLPNGKQVDDYPVWAYDSTDNHTTLRLDFDSGTKTLTGIACVSTAYSDTSPFGLMDCPDLLGIQDRWSEDDLVKKLGNPMKENRDGDVKILRYGDLGVQYFLTQGHVFMMSIFSTQ